MKYMMKQIQEARKLRRQGFTVADVATITRMSESAVRRYTRGYAI